MTDRIYLDVPYSEKDAAKKKGVRWDGENRGWWVNGWSAEEAQPHAHETGKTWEQRCEMKWRIDLKLLAEFNIDKVFYKEDASEEDAISVDRISWDQIERNDGTLLVAFASPCCANLFWTGKDIVAFVIFPSNAGKCEPVDWTFVFLK